MVFDSSAMLYQYTVHCSTSQKYLAREVRSRRLAAIGCGLSWHRITAYTFLCHVTGLRDDLDLWNSPERLAWRQRFVPDTTDDRKGDILDYKRHFIILSSDQHGDKLHQSSSPTIA